MKQKLLIPNDWKDDSEYIGEQAVYHVRPDDCATYNMSTNLKFIHRFNYVEKKAAEQGRSLKDMTLAEMDALWNEAKNQ